MSEPAQRDAVHEVFNQSSDFADFDAFSADPLLVAITKALPASVRDGFPAFGRAVASGEAQELARLANVDGPVLRAFDPKGRRIDRVDYHPAYHELMRRSVAARLHSSAWDGPAEEAGCRNEARAVRFYLTAGLECGHLCPLTMTNASVAALGAAPELRREWLPRVLSADYDPRHLPVAAKRGATLGMGMTERQGGTDVRANTTRAEPAGDGRWHLTGHKWFLSAPMSDAFLMLAQTGDGPTCFLVPRLRDDGAPNGLQIQRLKDKLGNRSNASSEIEIRDTEARIVGDSGRGVRTIIEMVTRTRLDCALASVGLMRAALAEAAQHCRERLVFGRPLAAQPEMTAVLADMALDVAGATALVLRLARAFDRAAVDQAEAAFVRVMTPVVKFWVCKLAPALAYEAMECLGGNGYIEEGRLARAYREAPVNAIWEGSGNVMALDLARVAERSPETFAAVSASIAADLDDAVAARFVKRAAETVAVEGGVHRRAAETLAAAAAGAELARLGWPREGRTFLRARLLGSPRSAYGLASDDGDAKSIVDSLLPPV